MDCQHNWIGQRGSNDKACQYCLKYPILQLRYQCKLCMVEACVFCLDKNNESYESVPASKVSHNIDRHKTLELRLIQLENTLYALQEKLLLCELEIQNLKVKRTTDQ